MEIVKKYSVYVFSVALLYVLQTSIFSNYIYGSVVLNIYIIIVLYINWFAPSPGVLAVSIVFGFIAHMSSPLPLLVDVMIILIIALTTQYLTLNILTNQTWWSLFLAGIVGIALYDIFLFTAMSQNLVSSLRSWYQFVSFPLFATIHLVTTAVILFAVYVIHHKYEQKQKRLLL